MRRGPGGDEEETSPFFEKGRGGERRGEEGNGEERRVPEGRGGARRG